MEQEPLNAPAVRAEVRKFIERARSDGLFSAQCDSWLCGWNPEFSRRLAQRGWIGVTVPAEFGGRGRGHVERHVIIEELLAAGAPVAAHWMADRQVAPALLRNGTPHQKRAYLPGICAGELYFAIGMSEPDSGSDLASVKTRATRDTDGAWVLEGTKVWTSGAHRSHYMVVLARTDASTSKRHEGLTQFIVSLASAGISVRPVRFPNGEHHFNEVHFSGVRLDASHVLGDVGNGWHQVMTELVYERSGPERFLSTLPLLESARRVRLSAGLPMSVGFALSRLWAIRRASYQVAERFAQGDDPAILGAIVKDVGSRLEGDLINSSRELVGSADPHADPEVATELAVAHDLLRQATLHSPGFTLRGGTNEIMRTLVGKAVLAN